MTWSIFGNLGKALSHFRYAQAERGDFTTALKVGTTELASRQSNFEKRIKTAIKDYQSLNLTRLNHSSLYRHEKKMDEFTASIFANRDTPIPVLTVDEATPKSDSDSDYDYDDDSRSVSGESMGGGDGSGRKKEKKRVRIKRSLSATRLKEKLAGLKHERGNAGGFDGEEGRGREVEDESGSAAGGWGAGLQDRLFSR